MNSSRRSRTECCQLISNNMFDTAPPDVGGCYVSVVSSADLSLACHHDADVVPFEQVLNIYIQKLYSTKPCL